MKDEAAFRRVGHGLAAASGAAAFAWAKLLLRRSAGLECSSFDLSAAVVVDDGHSAATVRPITAWSLAQPSGRRDVMAGVAAWGVAVAPARCGVPVGTSGDGDAVMSLYRAWRPLENASREADRRMEDLKAGSAADSVGVAVDRARSREVKRLMHVSDQANTKAAILHMRAMETPATSRAGAVAKLRMAIAAWPETRPAEKLEFHELAAIDAIEDALRLLGGEAT